MSRRTQLAPHLQRAIDEVLRHVPREQPGLAAPLGVVRPGEQVRFTIPGPPRPWARARVGENGGHYTPQAMRDAKRDFADIASKRRPPTWPLHAAFGLLVECFFEGPTPADWDNLGKLPSDAFNGVLWNDDRQVLDGRVRKHLYAERARTEILATVLGEMPKKQT